MTDKMEKQIEFFNEIQTSILLGQPNAMRYCEHEGTAKPFRELDATKCCPCSHHIINGGICDPL